MSHKPLVVVIDDDARAAAALAHLAPLASELCIRCLSSSEQLTSTLDPKLVIASSPIGNSTTLTTAELLGLESCTLVELISRPRTPFTGVDTGRDGFKNVS
jgi:hypothetical protein